MLTLAQVQNSPVANIAGVAPTSQQFIDYVNQAVKILMDKGEWFGTVKAMVGTTYKGCMIWPSGVTSVYAVNSGGRHVPAANYWYEFVEWNGQHHHDFENVVRPLGGRRPNSVIRFSGTVPVFNNATMANPFQVQATVGLSSDYGKTITIYGQDSNGVEVYSLRPDGSTQRGFLMTLGGLSVTSMAFSNIDAVIKDLTTAPVSLWVYSPSAPQQIPVAVYQGWETSPQYLFSDLRGGGNHCFNGQPVPHCIEALVSISPTPVAQPSDLIQLDCLDAIKMMVQSIRAREGNDGGDADALELTAVRRLNAELQKRFPYQLTPINLRAFGSSHARHYGIGRII
jgi:hypothetical protein